MKRGRQKTFDKRYCYRRPQAAPGAASWWVRCSIPRAVPLDRMWGRETRGPRVTTDRKLWTEWELSIVITKFFIFLFSNADSNTWSTSILPHFLSQMLPLSDFWAKEASSLHQLIADLSACSLRGTVGKHDMLCMDDVILGDGPFDLGMHHSSTLYWMKAICKIAVRNKTFKKIWWLDVIFLADGAKTLHYFKYICRI